MTSPRKNIYIYIYACISGWWFGTWILFSPIVRMMVQSDELIFFRGVGLNHQPEIECINWMLWSFDGDFFSLSIAAIYLWTSGGHPWNRFLSTSRASWRLRVLNPVQKLAPLLGLKGLWNLPVLNVQFGIHKNKASRTLNHLGFFINHPK